MIFHPSVCNKVPEFSSNTSFSPEFVVNIPKKNSVFFKYKNQYCGKVL